MKNVCKIETVKWSSVFQLHDLQELPPHVAEDSGGHLRAIHDYHVGSSDAYSEEADCEPDFEDDHFLSSYKNDAVS